MTFNDGGQAWCCREGLVMTAVRNMAVAGGVQQPVSGIALTASAPAARARQEPSDPFRVHIQHVLDAIRAEWSVPYLVTHQPGCDRPWRARRREHPFTVLTGMTPDELVRELRRDWGEAP